MAAYYNEFEPYAAQWLKNLIAKGLLPAGDIDERSILDVKADDLKGYTQCHFFAGIGGWSLALRMAGWSDSRPVWTGSCPCQPFSSAGKKAVKKTIDIYGLTGSASFESVGRQWCMENRLRQQLPLDGWTACMMTWKVKTTPSARRYCQLAVSARPIEGKDCGLWATPNTMDWMSDRSQEAMQRQFNTTRKGRTAPANLREQVNPAMWPTPTTVDSQQRTHYGNGSLALPGMARMWLTPGVSEDVAGTAAGKMQRMLTHQTKEALSGSDSQTENRGQLNPEFVCWLMGFPPEWEDCAPMAMPSSRKSRQNLSKQQCK